MHRCTLQAMQITLDLTIFPLWLQTLQVCLDFMVFGQWKTEVSYLFDCSGKSALCPLEEIVPSISRVNDSLVDHGQLFKKPV